MKEKIAISLNRDVLKRVDAKIDGSTIRSRSQAIEILLGRGLKYKNADAAVILVSKNHASLMKKKFRNSTLVNEQIGFFAKNNIHKVIVLLQGHVDIQCSATVVHTQKKNNGDALAEIENLVGETFVVMSGDTYNNFDLVSMLSKHRNAGKTGTVGLMSVESPQKYGTAVLEGDSVIKFEEKSRQPRSHIANAGIYIFNRDVFRILRGSIEREVLPRLAENRQLSGFFTMGEYVHFD